MITDKNLQTPEDIQILLKYMIAGFLAFGATKYQGILSEKMLGKYGKLFSYLSKGGHRDTPECTTLLHSLGNKEAVELLDLSYNMYFEREVPMYVKKYIEWYSFQNPRIAMDSLEKIKRIIGKLDSMHKGIADDNIINLFTDVEDEIDRRKNAGDEILGFRTGLDTIDVNCEGLQPGTVTCINAYAGTGKSKLSYFICNNLIKQGKKVLYFSLEVNAKTVLLNLLANWYKVDFKPLAKGKIEIDMDDYYQSCKNTLEIVDKTRDLSDMINLSKLRMPDVVIVDFVQNINCPGESEYERMTKVAVDLQLLAIETNAAVLDLSQINNEGVQYKIGGIIPSKGSGAIVASSDVAIVLYKRDNLLKMAIAKNKFGISPIEATLEANYSKNLFIDRGVAEF